MATTITDLAGLQNMNNDKTADYVLGGDIDASGSTELNEGAGFEPIGMTGDAFTGTFDGAGYTISDLFIDRSTTDYIGLFGDVDGATITDCVLTGVDMTGDDKVGGLAGYVDDSTITGSSTTGDIKVGSESVGVGGLFGILKNSTVSSCYSTATVNGSTTAIEVGGFVGWEYGNTITSCYATGAVTANEEVGGFAGEMDGASTYSKCYATGAVTSTGANGDYMGGFGGGGISYTGLTFSKCYATGNVSSTNGTNYIGGFIGDFDTGTSLTDCYAKGDVTAANASYVGGFIGYVDDGTATNCYSVGAVSGSAKVGGFIGDLNTGTITACFWDTETSGTETSDGGTGKTTAQMTTASTFIAGSWDFCTIWNRNDEYNDEYPYLRWQALAGEGETRSKTIGPVYDPKGRVPKGARVEARRADTGAVVETEYLDSNGKATFSDLPNDTNITFWTTWGGTTQELKTSQFFSTIIPVTEGGTGSSDAANARSNLGLGSEDSPEFTAIELGHATDTTVKRDSAGKVSVEGTVLVRSDTYFIAANNAPAHVKKQADKTCSGTNDHVEVLAALAAGKAVKCSEGTFYFEQAIALDSNDTFVGSGKNTIFTTTTANLDIITATGSSGSEKTGILLADFCIDGDAGSATNDCGIKCTYMDNSIVRNCWLQDNGEDGLYFITCDANSITNNICTGNTRDGIHVATCSFNTISGNVCKDNSTEGIDVTGNNTEDKNTIIANTCEGNNNGIYLCDSESDVVQSNICTGSNESGIAVTCGNHNCTIIGNTCQDNGYNGIALQSSNNLIVSLNLCTENSQDVTNTDSDILLSGVAYSLVQGNICRAGDETNKPKYGIDISDAGCDTVKVINNDLYDDGFVTGAYNDAGTGTIYVEPSDTEDAIAKKHTEGDDQALGTLGTKATPIDADKVIHRNSASSDALVTSTWTQVKAFLKTYFDSLTQVLTNKTLIATTNVVEEISTVASDSTPNPTGGSLRNFYTITALAANATFAAPSGTPANANKLIIRIKDNGTTRTLGWNAIYRAMEFALPTDTTASKTVYLGFIYNSADTKWDMVAINEEA